MSNEHTFLITYGLQNFVTHAHASGMHLFFIKSMESQKMIRHARTLIEETYGDAAAIQVA